MMGKILSFDTFILHCMSECQAVQPTVFLLYFSIPYIQLKSVIVCSVCVCVVQVLSE